MILGQHWPYLILVMFPADSSQFPTYGKKSIEALLNYYGEDKFDLSLKDEETVKAAAISPEVHTEWIIFSTLLAKKPEDSIALQLNELITNEMLVTMFPNLQKIASIGLHASFNSFG